MDWLDTKKRRFTQPPMMHVQPYPYPQKSISPHFSTMKPVHTMGVQNAHQ